MATIRAKFIIIICGVVLVLLAIASFSFLNLRHLAGMQDLGARRSAEAVLAKEASMGGLALSRVISDAVVNRDLKRAEREWGEKKTEVLKTMEETATVAAMEEEKKLCTETAAAYREAIGLFEGRLLPLLRTSTGTSPEIKALDDRIESKLGAVEATMDKFVGSVEKRMHDTDGEFDRAITIGTTITLVVGGLGILFVVATTLWLMRQVLGPVNAMVALLRDVAQGEGDLTKRLDDARRDEIGVASSWFNQFIGTIQGIITQVAGDSAQLASAARMLHATSEKIAAGVMEASVQSDTVATASEEMAATTGDIARSCHNAADSARLASTAAENGTTVVQRTVAGMQQIARRVRETSTTVESLGERSQQIGAIVGTIEDIADQTNLLALNAAIEAARAGDQGRGFAVVADEVRALAERTTRATREIGDMIKSIQHEMLTVVRVMEEEVHEVERGSTEAEESGLALSQIMEQICAVTQQVEQIAAAAEEQTATTGEITGNIQQVSQVVMGNAAEAAEIAETAAQVNSLSSELHVLVERFRT